jgi:hypothetical protein
MKNRVPLIASLLAHLALAALLGWVWRERLAPINPQPAVGAARVVSPLPQPRVAPEEPPSAAPAAARLTWARIESTDYRRYIANLRAVGCPERLIRDLIVLDLGELYDARRATLKPERLPPWAGGDRRNRAEAEFRRQIQALEEEQVAVTEELLGFPWNRAGIHTSHDEDVAVALFGHLRGDQMGKIVSLSEIYRDRARHVRERANDILLSEDKAALGALADEFEACAAGVATPALWEELILRVHAVFMLAGEMHIEAADLTGAQAREVARLSSLSHDLIRGELFNIHEPTEAESDKREAELKAAVAQNLGVEKALDLERAKDGRFREALEFTQARQLSRQTAVKAFEIRDAAEAEAERLRADDQLDPTTRQAQLAELQAATTEALTKALGAPHISTFMEKSSEWLAKIGGSEPARNGGRE